MTDWVLGVNAPPPGWHDPAACLVAGDGTIVAFSEEERFTGKRHALHSPPAEAARYCLGVAGIEPGDVDAVALGWDVPLMHPGRYAGEGELLSDALGPEWSRVKARVVPVRHHLAHATCAFYASGRTEAGVLVIDGTGEGEATTIWQCRWGQQPGLVRTWSTALSLGCAYDAASEWLGFSMHNAGKTMGLAAYGRAQGLEVPELVRFDDADYEVAVPDPRPGMARTGPEVADQYTRLVDSWKSRFAEIGEVSGPRADADGLHLDPAAVRVSYSAQRLVEQTVGWLARETRSATGFDELCLAGGVGLNCSTNGLLDPPLYVPPVTHDAGVALGAAWHVCPPKRPSGPLSAYLGAELGALESTPDANGCTRRPFDPELVTALLLDGKIGAIAEGRAEVGPRALCHRSIIAIPRPAELNGRLNRIKGREPWRPFGPVVPASRLDALWEHQPDLSRYMLGAAKVTEEGKQVAPAAIHVDGTTRPQVATDDAPVASSILEALEEAGVPPSLINTSFNGRHQPIVNDAPDAMRTFLRMDLDFLVLEGDLLVKRPEARKLTAPAR